MNGFGVAPSAQRMKLRAYGVSAGSVRSSLEDLTGIKPTKKEAVHTDETGRVFTESEVFSGGPGYCDCSCSGGSGDGEGLIVALIIVAVLMIMVAVIWTVIMIAFSLLTVGGFLKRRYRTVIVVEKLNREFMGRLAISIFRRGGVLEFPFGHEGYDAWSRKAFNLHLRLKYIRQFSLVLGIGWGWVEVFYKLYDILLAPPDYSYNLWPLRIVMVAIFLPLLLYSPVLEIQFDNSRRDGEEQMVRLLHEEHNFSPDHPMSFMNPPRTVIGISSAAIKKIEYDSYGE